MFFNFCSVGTSTIEQDKSFRLIRPIVVALLSAIAINFSRTTLSKDFF